MVKRVVLTIICGMLLTIEARSNDVFIFTLKNPVALERKDEPIVLLRNDIEKKTGNLKHGFSMLVTTISGVTIPSQVDDLNGDGIWDELAFLVDFQPNETIKLNIKPVLKTEVPVFKNRTHVHLGVSRERNDRFVEVLEEVRPKDHIAQSLPYLYQYEGPGWENDKIAFRNYFDSRNGMDVYGKLVPEMILDSVGLPGKSYHELAYWGMDVLKVGTSLGVGSIALSDGDSLFRLGATESAHYKVIVDGPVRAIFQLDYSGWKVKDENLNFKEQITIWGGKNFYSAKAWVSGHKTQHLNLVTGVTTFHVIDENYIPEFINTKENYSYIVINNVLSEHNDFLSIGLLANSSEMNSWGRTPETGINDAIIKTAYMVFNQTDKPVEFYIFAGWELADIRFKTEKLLNSLMEDEAERLNHTIQILY